MSMMTGELSHDLAVAMMAAAMAHLAEANGTDADMSEHIALHAERLVMDAGARMAQVAATMADD